MACAVVGMPLITPVEGSIASPAGSAGETAQVGVPVRPVTVGAVVAGIATPTVPVIGGIGVTLPALTVIWTVYPTVPEVAPVPTMVYVAGAWIAVGVPLITAGDAVIESPAGSGGDTVQVGAPVKPVVASVFDDGIGVFTPPNIGGNTVYGTHWAYRSAFVANGNDAWFAYGVPEPSGAVFQPVNIYPLRVNAFAVNAAAEDETWLAIDPEPPFE